MNSDLRKIFIITGILLYFSQQVSAPESKYLAIFEQAPVEPYKKLAYAIGMVETKGDTLAFNPKEEAAGYFQIRPIRLIDYNKRTGNSYTMQSLFRFETSEKIFLYFADLIGPYNLEQIARKWNGSGDQTVFYWNRIKKFL
jgi:hypothetical protein